MAMDAQSVAIAIPTKNRHEPLRRTLALCLGQVQRTPIYICDQSETPFPCGANYSIEHRPDISSLPAARNALLQQIKEDYVLFIDDDTDLSRNFTRVLSSLIQGNPQIDAWGAVVETRSRRIRRLHRLSHFGVFADPRRQTARRCDRPTRALFGCCFAVRRQAAMEVNGFDERRRGYSLGEDYDFCLSMTKAGFSMRFAKDLLAIHRRDGEDRANPSKRGFAKGQWLRYLARRHGSQNPTTVVHLGLAVLAAASGMGHETASSLGVLKGLNAL